MYSSSYNLHTKIGINLPVVRDERSYSKACSSPKATKLSKLYNLRIVLADFRTTVQFTLPAGESLGHLIERININAASKPPYTTVANFSCDMLHHDPDFTRTYEKDKDFEVTILFSLEKLPVKQQRLLLKANDMVIAPLAEVVAAAALQRELFNFPGKLPILKEGIDTGNLFREVTVRTKNAQTLMGDIYGIHHWAHIRTGGRAIAGRPKRRAQKREE